MYNFKKIKIFSIILLICIILVNLCSPIFAVNLKSVEGLILYNNDKIQLLSIEGKIYDTNPEMEEDVEEFCKVIGNSGMKVKATIEDNKEEQIKLLGISTAVELSGDLKTKWNEYIKNKYGTFSELEGIITKDNDTYSFISKDKIYSPATFEYDEVKKYAEIIANKGIEVKIESAVYNDNSILINYVVSKDKLPEEQLEQWKEYKKEILKKYTKTGVIISYGSDSYMLVENNTNKMYFLTTSNELIYFAVPKLADRGIQTSLFVNETSENTLEVFDINKDELPENIQKELEEIEKKYFESIVFNVEGYILKENNDYNIYFNNGTEKLGIETTISDVSKVVTSVANDKSVLLKLEGFINYEQTVMDVRNVTFLVDITDGETLKKLQEAFPQKEVSSSTTNATVSGNTNSSSNLTQNNNTIEDFFNSSSSFSNLYNSMFGTQNNSNLTSNFSSLFGESAFGDMSEMFNSYNAMMQNQSGLLNSSNLSNFNFEEFQAAFNSMYSSNQTQQSENNQD